MFDSRGIPSSQCLSCGSDLIRITAKFDPETYEISMYLLHDAECSICGSPMTAPTPLDIPIK